MYGVYVGICIYRQTHSPPLPPFCFFDNVGLCSQTKQSFRTLGAASFSSASGCVANSQSCSCTHLAEVPRHDLCSALLLPWSLGDKSFYKKLTVFEVMNMQWLSLVLKHQNRGWHPPPLWVAAESANELSCSFMHTVCCCGF